MRENTIWLADHDWLESLQWRLGAIIKAHGLPTQAQVEEAAREMATKSLRRASGNIAVVPIHGVIEQKSSLYSMFFGGFSTDWGEQAIQQLASDRSVSAIVLDVDSPGGTSYGVEELSNVIHAARDRKPIHAVANSMAASAAYWLATSASSLSVTPGGDVGSVGVYAMHVDFSKALENDGIKVSVVKAGKYKAELNSYEPLSDGARDNLQEMVDATYGRFVGALARNRGVSRQEVREKYGQGRVLSSEKALAAGMVDRVASLSEVLGRLTGSSSEGTKAAQEMRRLRHEQRKRLAALLQG